MGRVDHVNLVEDFRQFGAERAGMVDRLADGPEFRNGDEFRLHQTAGGFLFIAEAAFEFRPVYRRKVFEDALTAVILKVFENGRRIV